MKKVTLIAPNTANTIEQPKLRVAAYARVSTDSEDQLISLETQKSHYESMIKANPDWEFAGLYYDEGITGTKKEKRPELLRMIKDCEKQNIDLIMTKSISRFARNTMDCLELVRRLTKLGISVYFESENINTGSMESELMLSILSGLAEGESASIAENNKWSIQRRFQNGTYKIACSPYGYDAVDGELVVNEQQAEIVRFIFSEVLSGKGTHKIAKDLNSRGLKGKNGGNWTSSTIRGMIGNEKYIGDAIFQKTYSDSHFNRYVNRGEREQYLIHEHHEAIISRKDYDAAQLVMEQLGKEKGVEKQNEKYQNRYPFSGKIICGECGATFKRRIHSSGKKYIAWSCNTHINEIEKCSMKFISNSDFEFAFVTMMNKLIFGHQIVLRPLLLSLRGIDSNSTMETLQEIDKKLLDIEEQRKVLMGLQTRGYLESAVYTRGNNELLQEAGQLQRRKESLINFINSDTRHLSEVSALLQFTSKAIMQTRFDDALFRRFVDLQKTYTTDFLTKTRVKNHGVVPQYYVENSHEAIIPREIFMQVQEELIQRRIVHTSPNGKNRTFSCIHCFSNMIVCGGCGEVFRRVHWNNRGKKSVVWRCVSRLENTGLFCEARTVPESQIEQVLVTAINQTLCDKDSFLATLRENIETVIAQENDQTLAGIDARLQELQTELLKLANSKVDYEDVADEIFRLREEKQKVQLENIGRDELKNRIADMSVFLQEQLTAIAEYDEPLVRRLIEKVTVYEDKFTMEFKSGMTVDVEE